MTTGNSSDSDNELRLHHFTEADLQRHTLPQHFNNPFEATPHPLCMVASAMVMRHIAQHDEWHDELRLGKMFGVLLVTDEEGHPGFLAAFSGLLDRRNDIPYFVPPIYDMLQPDGFFKTGERQIDAINKQVRQLLTTGVEAERLAALKHERRQRSAALQQQLFKHFIVRNGLGEQANLLEVFKQTAQRIPPGGTGECAAPKLLQHAFSCGLTPKAVAEFWYGQSTPHRPRQHAAFYPACEEKCRPLLSWMLRGISYL